MKRVVFTIAFLSVATLAAARTSKEDLADCWAYEFIAGDIAASQGRQKSSIMHYNAKNAFQKVAEQTGAWDTQLFKGAANAQKEMAKSGNLAEIKSIGAKCNRFIDSNADWKAEFQRLMSLSDSIAR